MFPAGAMPDTLERRGRRAEGKQALLTCSCLLIMPWSPQVFFYKRAQIFVGDVYGALGGQGLGAFHDMAALTMFADYRGELLQPFPELPLHALPSIA